jgi:hypothetical protein
MSGPSRLGTGRRIYFRCRRADIEYKSYMTNAQSLSANSETIFRWRHISVSISNSNISSNACSGKSRRADIESGASGQLR